MRLGPRSSSLVKLTQTPPAWPAGARPKTSVPVDVPVRLTGGLGQPLGDDVDVVGGVLVRKRAVILPNPCDSAAEQKIGTVDSGEVMLPACPRKRPHQRSNQQ
jgi:hypothetical protein